MTPSRRLVPAAAMLVLLCTGIAGAQSVSPPSTPYGSRYLSMENPGYDAITNLRRRGLLTTLDPLAQPYHRIDIARAIMGLDPDTLHEPVRHWVRMLRDEMAPELARLAGRDSVQLGYEALAGVTTSTSRRLDPLLPWRQPSEKPVLTITGNRAWLDYGVGGWFERGRFAGDVRLFHPLYDEGAQHNGDPDGRDPGGIVVLNKTDNAYLDAAFSLGHVFVGRMARNWGPLGTGGLMISDNPTTYPQIGLDLTGGPLTLRYFVGQLDTLNGSDRYVAAHELEYRQPNFGIEIGEARVYVSEVGPGLSNLNPIDLYFFEQDINPQEGTGNSVINGKLWIQRGGLVLYGESLLDDIHLFGHDTLPAPVRGALDGGFQYVDKNQPRVEWGGEYRIVSSLAYWSARYTDQWDYYYRGLGDNFDDYDRLTLRASVYPSVSGLKLTPEFQLQRKGEGDFRTLQLTDTQYHYSPSFLIGVVERTARVGLAGRYQPTRMFFIDWDGGVNFVKNANHQAGHSLTEFQGVARFGFTFTEPSVGSK